MAPPSKLSISTSSVLRLVKEEASYHKEQQQQEARIKKLESSKDDENAEFVLQQEVRILVESPWLRYDVDMLQRRGLEETKAIFPSLKLRITDALAKLEAQLVRD
jgi:tubulin-specific chaperone A